MCHWGECAFRGPFGKRLAVTGVSLRGFESWLHPPGLESRPSKRFERTTGRIQGFDVFVAKAVSTFGVAVRDQCRFWPYSVRYPEKLGVISRYDSKG